jgi:hypothetical protein
VAAIGAAISKEFLMITNIFLDIETIPAQSDAIKNRILAEAAKQKAEVKAPANYKDAYKITEYIRRSTPKLTHR